jgi:hypothetical protein
MKRFAFRAFVVISLVAAVSGCSNSAPVASPTPSPTPSSSPISSTVPQTPEEVWIEFSEISRQSCREAYEGLIEEQIAGPDVGKLKIRLTFEQAGENSMAYQLPNGNSEIILNFADFYACEIQGYLLTLEDVQYDENMDAVYQYSPSLPLQVTFNPQDSTYTAVRPLEDGTIRSLTFIVVNGLVSQVQNLLDGSETTLTFGQPGPPYVAIVNDAYDAFFSN